MLVVADVNPAGTTISVAWSAVRTTTVRTPSEVLPLVAEQATASKADAVTAVIRTGASRHRTKGCIGEKLTTNP
jgi:hypothetical protein